MSEKLLLLQNLGLLLPLRYLKSHLTPKGRAEARRNSTNMSENIRDVKNIFRNQEKYKPTSSRTALIAGYEESLSALHHIPIVAAFIRLGIRPVIMLRSPILSAAVKTYRAMGIAHFAYYEEYPVPLKLIRTQMSQMTFTSQTDVMDLHYEGVSVGRYALSSLMRQTRCGHFNFGDPQQHTLMKNALQKCIIDTFIAKQILDEWQPEQVVLVDRGYTPQGPTFDLAMAAGCSAFTVNYGHRNNTLVMKRYSTSNQAVHYASLSDDTWSRLSALPENVSMENSFMRELTYCYESAEWYNEVGTAHHSHMQRAADLRTRLKLDPTKKTVLVFPHIFWDATFFWGDDLYSDYEDWFKSLMKLAYEQPNLNWVVKVHPANVVKGQRDGVGVENNEVTALTEIGPLPDHITLLDADTDISTISLYEIGDICLTVRGTPGIEAAAFGLRVVTAGTGRLDRRGFTRDANTVEEYEAIIRSLDTIPPMTAREKELANRFGYGLFVGRVLPLTSYQIAFNKTDRADMQVTFLNPECCIFETDDTQQVIDWLDSGAEDFINAAVLAEISAAEMNCLNSSS